MNTKLRCLLLDDELPGLSYLKMLCEQLPELEVVKAFNNVDVFLAELPTLEFDLCILDIEMPQMSGLQIASLLNSKLVIFTTAYKDYAAEAFDLDAIDYVRKPIKKERLQQAVVKAQSRLQNRQQAKTFMQLNSDKGKALIFFDQLLYVKTSEVDSRDKVAWLTDGMIITLKNISFEKLTEQLPITMFVRINKREIIALKSVQAFSADAITVLLHGNISTLILSEVFRKDFLQKVSV